MGEKNAECSGIMTYRERVRYYRRDSQHIHQFFRHLRNPDLTLKERFWKSYKELALSYHAVKDIFKEVDTFGNLIKEEYGRSLWVQFLQLMYLKFVLGGDILEYRTYLLFKKERWEQVRDFTFVNEYAEQDFITMAKTGSNSTYKHEFDPFKDKTQFYRHCIKHKIPTPAILRKINLNDPDFTANQLVLPREDIFIKTIDGARSFGAARFHYRNQKFVSSDGEELGATDIVEFLKDSEYNSVHDRIGEFIVQPVLTNHPDWQPFTSGALATCRILTGRSLNDKRIIPIAAVLRMPTGSAIVDNFSAGGIASPINIKTGKLGMAVTHKPIGESFEFNEHPDTGYQLKGTLLPGWTKLVEFTKEVHSTFDLTFVSWDISYTSSGFVVVEGNGIWGCQVLETAYNKPMIETPYSTLFDSWMTFFKKKYDRETVTASEI